MGPKFTGQKKTFFYAVRRGRTPGVYESWTECQMNTNGYQGAVFKKFATREEAQLFATNSLPDCKPLPQEHERITPLVENKRKTSDELILPAKRIRTEPPLFERKKMTVVYTDGASSNNGKTCARAGYGVYWGDNDPRNASIRLDGEKQTNQRAEASAVNHALEQSQNGTELLEIMTDSQYVIKAATVWSKKWVANEWKSANGSDVQNRDLFERMLSLIASRKGPVQFTYVPGHKGVEGNEKADQLAVAGAQK
ncbi:hypothetical protein INT48_000844 [Thamnidium elegans]|uniref:Ribonuclease H n=1 Tax=Thamnidium elegans TaxID=101142 RepID=A0A8H7W2W6_9FUNG|nr:hypothetical protein INT48_000844 [Thamnidium elegans]